MIRFNVNNKFNFLIFFSDLTRTIFGGDRIKRLSSKVKFILDKEFLKKNKKICIIDFGCGSMEIAKEIQNKKYMIQYDPPSHGGSYELYEHFLEYK